MRDRARGLTLRRRLTQLGRVVALYALLDYAEYYNESRTHQSLDGNAPIARQVEHVGQVIATPVLNGLHHRYSRVA